MQDNSRSASHTAQVGSLLYDIYKLQPYAKNLPVTIVPLAALKSEVAEGQYYWQDTTGEWLGPYQILENWESAQHNPYWTKHIEKIKHANIDEAIWMTDGYVFDGMHRLTKAFLEKRTDIKCQVWQNLPPEAIVEESHG